MTRIRIMKRIRIRNILSIMIRIRYELGFDFIFGIELGLYLYQDYEQDSDNIRINIGILIIFRFNSYDFDTDEGCVYKEYYIWMCIIMRIIIHLDHTKYYIQIMKRNITGVRIRNRIRIKSNVITRYIFKLYSNSDLIRFDNIGIQKRARIIIYILNVFVSGLKQG